MSSEFQFLIYQSADEDVSVNAVIRDETIRRTVERCNYFQNGNS